MDKYCAVIELGSKKMKLVIGYELEGQVYVLYALSKPYGYAIENGEIVDAKKIAQAVREIKTFRDPSAQLTLNISEVILTLPPYGLRNYTSQQITTVVSGESYINKIDIINVHSLIKNGEVPEGNALVNIVPVFYELNEGRRFINPPLGEKSSTIKIGAMVHTLPKKIYESYLNAVTSSGMNVKRCMIAPHGASLLIGSYKDLPDSYVLVDIGSTMTTVSLVGEKRLFGSTYFAWGGDKITERIIESFNINESDAEKYKITYGIDNREMNFKAPVCKSFDGEGNEIKHYVDELNEIIKDELSTLVKELNSSLDELLKTYDKATKSLPMLLIGGGSRLNGLVEYVTPKVPSEYVKVVTPRALGARDSTYTNVLGIILAQSVNPAIGDDNHPKVGQVTRDEK